MKSHPDERDERDEREDGFDRQYIISSQSVSNQHNVFLDCDIDKPSRYRDLITLLFSAGEDDEINIFLNSNGGHFDTALAIVEGLKATNASVTAVLVGSCHSAASIISMYCHNVAVTDSAYSMVHTASFGSSGSVGNVKSHTEFTCRQVEKFMIDTYSGFLTPAELANIAMGAEMWFGAEEIRTRMASRVKYLAAAKAKKSKVPKDKVTT